MKSITDVTVNFTSTDCYYVQWNHNNARFHYWNKVPTIVYKNPPLVDGKPMLRSHPNYFPTRYLKSNTIFMRWALTEVKRIVDGQSMIEKAKIAYDLEQQSKINAIADHQELYKRGQSVLAVLNQMIRDGETEVTVTTSDLKAITYYANYGKSYK
jgi:hypothetical protein